MALDTEVDNLGGGDRDINRDGETVRPGQRPRSCGRRPMELKARRNDFGDGDGRSFAKRREASAAMGVITGGNFGNFGKLISQPGRAAPLRNCYW